MKKILISVCYNHHVNKVQETNFPPNIHNARKTEVIKMRKAITRRIIRWLIAGLIGSATIKAALAQGAARAIHEALTFGCNSTQAEYQLAMDEQHGSEGYI
jgi:hypothetical protein